MKTEQLDDLLLRQLRDAGCDGGVPPDEARWRGLLRAVSSTYRQQHDLMQTAVRDIGFEATTMNRPSSRGNEQFPLEAVVEALDEGICLIDSDHRITLLNAAGRRLLGVTDEQVVGATLDDLAAGDTGLAMIAGRLLRIIRQRVQHGRQYVATALAVPTLQGGRIPMDITVSAIALDRRVTGTAVTFCDVSERQLTQHALWEGEERFRSFFRNAAIGMMRLDVTARVDESNPPLRVMLDRSESELATSPIHDFLEAEDAAESRRMFHDLVSGAVERYQLEALLRGTGQPRWIHITMSMLRDQAGWPTFAIGTVEDITERKSLERQLHDAQKLEAIGRLAAGVAHEINTPIQFIGDNVQFLGNAIEVLMTALDPGPADHGTAGQLSGHADLEFVREEAPMAIKETLDGVERVSGIVKAMKAMSHHDAGPHALADINKAITDAVTFARHEIKYVADVALDLDDIPPVMCNVADLGQVLLNLLVNAAHAIADVVTGTGQRGRIEVRSRSVGDQVVVDVSDSGAGVPVEIQHQLFEPFFTTKAVGKGTGQGLAMARAIIAGNHGGDISFTSSAGAGTCFSIRLPLQQRN